jgi:hypothetical protein
LSCREEYSYPCLAENGPEYEVAIRALPYHECYFDLSAIVSSEENYRNNTFTELRALNEIKL